MVLRLGNALMQPGLPAGSRLFMDDAALSSLVKRLEGTTQCFSCGISIASRGSIQGAARTQLYSPLAANVADTPGLRLPEPLLH